MMIEIYCPVCNRVNNAEDERCWYCQALLHKPGSGATEPGEDSKINHTSEGTVGDTGQPPAEQGDDQAVPAEEIPEWLARIRARKQADQDGMAVQPRLEQSKKASAAPDWLKEMGGAEISDLVISPEEKETGIPVTERVTPEQRESSSDLQGEEISWLQELGRDEEPQTVDNESPDLEQQPDSPILSSDVEEAPSSNSNKVEQDEQPFDIPDLGEEPNLPLPGKDFSQDEPVIKTHLDDAATELTSDSGDFNLPLTLDQTAGSEGSEVQPTSQGSQSLDGRVDEKLDVGQVDENEQEPWQIPEGGPTGWKREEEAVTSLNQPVEPFDRGQKETPGSLSEEDSFSLADQSQTESDGFFPGLDELSVESAGASIFAGIDGVLQGSGSIGASGKLRDYASGLEVTQQQESRVALFAEILKGNPAQKAVSDKATPISTGMKVVKAILTLVLLAAVTIPFFYSTDQARAPVLYPSELITTVSTIQNLPADRPVLLVANYEAALAGELKLVADPVIRHLVSRGIPLALLSTNAVGSATLPAMVSEISNQMGYDQNQKVLDFGYMPGGVIGFSSLTQNLRSTLFYTAALEPAWVKPVVQNINQLTDFSAVILLTDDAEVARSWTEQVSPKLGNIPLLMVLSAQASPMVQPYYASGQITGFVAGEGQAVTYEQVTGSVGHASMMYGRFQPALVLTAVTIFLGGLISLITAAPAGKKKGNGTA